MGRGDGGTLSSGSVLCRIPVRLRRALPVPDGHPRRGDRRRFRTVLTKSGGRGCPAAVPGQFRPADRGRAGDAGGYGAGGAGGPEEPAVDGAGLWGVYL